MILTDVPINIWLSVSLYTLSLSLLSLFIIIVIHNDYSKSIKLHKNLRHKAEHDSLTNIPNLETFKKRFKDISFNKNKALVMIDIDNFKEFNDINGHPGGDQALIEVSQVLVDNIRHNDCLARYGGEEFILGFADVWDIKEAVKISERIRKTIENIPFENEEKLPKNRITLYNEYSKCS
ncbi:MAG: GGDEF domain-containing protein [Halanaerobiales bacterium]